jgi:hypothetical protein
LALGFQARHLPERAPHTNALIIYKPKSYCKRSPSFDTAQPRIALFHFARLWEPPGKKLVRICFSLRTLDVLGGSAVS